MTVGGSHLATAAGRSSRRPGGAHRSPAQHRAGADGRLLPRAAGDDAPGAAAARRRSDVPQRPRRRLAVLPVARRDLHRPPAPPDRRVHQHRERPGAPDRRLPGVRPQRQHVQGLQRRAAERWLHDRVHRQVHERLQHVHQPRRELRAREDPRVGRVQRGAQWRLPRVGLPHDVPRQGRHGPDAAHPEAAAQRAGEGARPAPTPPTSCPATPTPSCASTATRRSRTSSRSPPTARTRRCSRPTPTTRRSRRPSPTAHPRATRRVATAAPRPCGRLTLRDLKGYADPRDDNTPTYLRRNGTTTPCSGVERQPGHARRQGRPPAVPRPRPDGAVHRPDARPAACRGRAEHLLLPDLRQRLPPRPAPAQRRQGHALRLRHARAARRGRSRRAAGCRARSS